MRRLVTESLRSALNDLDDEEMRSMVGGREVKCFFHVNESLSLLISLTRVGDASAPCAALVYLGNPIKCLGA
jgi:hypothetical protein